MMTDLEEFKIWCRWHDKYGALREVRAFEKRTESEQEHERKLWVNEGIIRPVVEKQQCDDCG